MADSTAIIKEEDVELDDMEDVDDPADSGTKKEKNSVLEAYQHLVMMENLPPSVKRRIKALKKLQFETTKIESEFYKEFHKLEMKYDVLYEPLRAKRKQVITGQHEPTDVEAEWPSDDEEEKEEDLCSAAKNKMKIEENNLVNVKATEEKQDEKGVPNFWLIIFKNVSLLADMVQEHDEPILKHLQDIKVKMLDNPMGFILEFHFSPNEHFTNTVLTKKYGMKCEPDPTDPFSFDGPEIINCEGCVIDWKKGKNVTVKIVKKKQKHKSKGSVRTITRTVQNDSFFNFFNPPTPPNDEEADDHIQSLLTADFEIGHYIRDRIVPNAVLFFTGEALEDEDDEYEEEEEEEDGDEEYEDGDVSHARPTHNKQQKSDGANNPSECKQQ